CAGCAAGRGVPARRAAVCDMGPVPMRGDDDAACRVPSIATRVQPVQSVRSGRDLRAAIYAAVLHNDAARLLAAAARLRPSAAADVPSAAADVQHADATDVLQRTELRLQLCGRNELR